MLDTRSITKLLQEHLTAIKEDIEMNMERYARNASMRSVKSLRVEVNGEEGILWGLQSFLAMERGRAGGRVPRGFPQIIEQWIRDKGIRVKLIPYKTNRPHKYTEEERSLRSAASAIAYTIMKHGTRLHRKKGFDDIFTTAIDYHLVQMYKEMTLVVGYEIDRIHQEP